MDGIRPIDGGRTMDGGQTMDGMRPMSGGQSMDRMRIMSGGQPMSEAEKSAWIINRLEEIVRNLDIPVSLSGYGVTGADLEPLVASGMAVRRLLDNNMREVTAADARAMYLQIME